MSADRPARLYGGVASALPLTGLVDHQLDSYRWLVEEGLSEALLEVVFTDGGERIRIELASPVVEEPELSADRCEELRLSYEGRVRCSMRMYKLGSGEIVERAGVRVCMMPVMLDDGSFVITGSRRVVVSQFVRAPGVYFGREYDATCGDDLAVTRFLPARGTRITLEMSRKRVLTARLDRARRVNAAVLARAVGIGRERISGVFAEADPSGEWFGPTLAAAASVLDSEDDCLVQILGLLEPGAPASAARAREHLRDMLMSGARLDLGELGRRRLDESLYGGTRSPGLRSLEAIDLLALLRETALVQMGRREPDDVDHLGNRRVRRAGELACESFRQGLMASRRATVERLLGVDTATLLGMPVARLVNFDQVERAVRAFFRTSPLCQFLDNSNPLSEITHKRRITALGPGGIDRRRAGVEVRDVHASYYGRICPIESPEGQNIGLVNALAAGASFDRDGFIVVPYLRVRRTTRADDPSIAGRTLGMDVDLPDGGALRAGTVVGPTAATALAGLGSAEVAVLPYVSSEVVWLGAFEEEAYRIGQATLGDREGREIAPGMVEARYGGEVVVCDAADLDCVDMTVRQMFSASTLMVPFVNHNDANRALMGANMQRQALPLASPDAPLVSTGMERVISASPGHSVWSAADGTVTSASAERVVVTRPDGVAASHPVRTLGRSNQNTFISQRTRVSAGQVVRKGDCLADGYASEGGRAALGQNVLVAFLSWEGFNYEDSIVVSERVLSTGKFRSTHIRDRHVIVRNESAEELTSEVPGIGAREARALDGRGLVRVGTRVRAGDILVGRRAPREDASEAEALLIGVSGDPLVRRWRDTSLRAAKGDAGVVVSASLVSGEVGDPLPAGAREMARVSIARTRALSVGDKMSGRHGNKGLVCVVLPVEDMPVMPDGRPVEVVLNPLGVPSRMNLGQLMEVHLGMAAERVGFYAETPAFDGASWTRIQDALAEAHLAGGFESRAGPSAAAERGSGTDAGNMPEGELARSVLAAWLAGRGEDVPEGATLAELVSAARERELSLGDPSPVTGKFNLRDGRSGRTLPGCQTVGVKHMLKLSHLADDKMHARSVGTYQEITQQPLGGKSQGGGQRLGEMEVWALESYGAAFNLLEMMTVKSDDVNGRDELYSSVIAGDGSLTTRRPESFRVLAAELAALGISIEALQERYFGEPEWSPVVTGK